MPYQTTDDISTYYEIQGSGPPLVLLHGAFVDCRMWDAQYEALSRDYRVVRYDLRGHGRTGPSDRDRYSVDLFAEDLRRLLDALQLERVALCGLSLGGMVAQAFAVRYPERVGGLVLAGAPVSMTLTLHDKLQRYLLAPRWLMLPAVRLLGGRRMVDFSFAFARLTRNPQWFGRDPEVREYVRQAMLRTPSSEYVKIYGALYDFVELELSRVTAPVLVLNGEHETRSVRTHGEHIRRRVEHADLAIIPDAGHMCNMENAEEFNRHLERFLDRTVRREPSGRLS